MLNPLPYPQPQFFDHSIHLKPNSEPVNIRSYRYPPIQKAEIEKLVEEMLTRSIIQPSQSPFPSPMPPVKKKDGPWQFCVDYCQLNALTIKNKFPILLLKTYMTN